MARADFYILNDSTSASRFSCTITSKACAQGNSVYIFTKDNETASKIDDLLWTFQDISFLPHAKIDKEESNVPVIIGWPGEKPPQADVMINLTDSIPNGVESFARVIEIVEQDPKLRENGRLRYKAYRELGFEMFKHEITTGQ
jgi:DNA polymerase III subunit chi